MCGVVTKQHQSPNRQKIQVFYFSEMIIVWLLTFSVSKMIDLFYHRICFHGITNHSGSGQRSCPKRTETSQSCDVGRNKVRFLLPNSFSLVQIHMTLVCIDVLKKRDYLTVLILRYNEFSSMTGLKEMFRDVF